MINVTKTYLPPINKFKSYIDKIYKSNWVTNHGKLVQKLEKRLKEYLGVKNILLVANGTLALQIAYKVLGLKGEVITTPFSFVATTSSLVWEGLNPVFADIDKETLCIAPHNIEKAITKNTSAIVPVHIFGNACEVEEIQRIAKKHNLKVIYDASHAFCNKYKGKSLLRWGDISTLSFHATKVFHTIEGGALVINSDKIYKKAKMMIDFGITAKDTIQELGINAKMNEIEAAMGLCVLENTDKRIKEREKIYSYYSKHLSPILKTQKWNKNCTNNYNFFPVIFNSQSQLMKVKGALNKNKIYPRRYFYPSLDTLNYIKGNQKMPVSRDIASRILCLPMYRDLKKDCLDKIIKIINSNLKE